MTDAEPNPARLRRARLTLIGLFLIAIVPLVGAYVLFYVVRDNGPWATTNHGELLQPLRSTGPLAAVGRDGVHAPLTGHWWLLLVAVGECAGPCVDAAGQLRAVQILLREDSERVRRGLLVVDGPAGADEAVAVAVGDPDVIPVVGRLDGLSPGIYIVDPLGNLVLHYPYAGAGKPVLEDLKKLLKVSRIG